MSLIEQAARRLEELRRAGVVLPSDRREALRSGLAGGSTNLVAPGPLQRGGAEPTPSREGATATVVSFSGQHSKRVELDLERLAANHIVTPLDPRSRTAEEFRVIKRPLISNALGKGAAEIRDGNLIMVTSALPGEGKTFSAVNLAMSIAMEFDYTVLLVDADVAKPSLPKVLGLDPMPGLLDLLTDRTLDARDVLLRTNVEKLSILPAGTQNPQATELLASDAMVSLLAEMSRRYSDRIIIFDSPPLLLTTEASVLASHVGQVVLVVKAERTLQSDVMQALTAIESCPIKLLMLNQARSKLQGAYGYGYGYGA